MTDYTSAYFDTNKLVAATSKQVRGGSLEIAGDLKPVYVKRDPFEYIITSIRERQGAMPSDFAIRHDFTVSSDVVFRNHAGISQLGARDGYVLRQRGFEGGRVYEALQHRVLRPISDGGVADRYVGVDLKMIMLHGQNGSPMFYRWDHQFVGSMKPFLPHGWSRIPDVSSLRDADFLVTAYAYHRARSVPKRPREGFFERLFEK